MIYNFTQSSEGFITARPLEQYVIPQLKGVSARYVRIRPSITSGDGYLTISQIQVIDQSNINVALNRQVTATATSTGGSLLDQKYGQSVLQGAVYVLLPGTSDDVYSIIDGVTVPKTGLTNVFETSKQNACPLNPNATDTEYVEIDLSSNIVIKDIIYSGRSDPIRRTIQTVDGTSDVIDQITRLTNMRLELYNENRTLTFSTTFTPDPSTKIAKINIDSLLFTVNLGGGSSTVAPISFPNVNSYTTFARQFITMSDMNTPNATLIKKVNALYTPVNTNSSPTTLQRTFDVSENIFYKLASSTPLLFYTDIFQAAGCPSSTNNFCRPNNDLGGSVGSSVQSTISPDLQIQVFGTLSPQARQEMIDSLTICKNIYIGSPELIENYIRLDYRVGPPGTAYATSDGITDNIPVVITNPSNDTYIRNCGPLISCNITTTATSNRLCMPDVIQAFQDGKFDTAISKENQQWNKGAGGCDQKLTPAILALIPFNTRNFITKWVEKRTTRYIQFRNTSNPDKIPQRRIASPFIRQADTINVLSPTTLDSIAQQFYEFLGGTFSMKYIYDVLPLGTTMIDIRFDLLMHSDSDVSYGPIAALKTQYNNLLQSGAQTLTEDIVDKAAVDYVTNITKSEQDAITNTLTPVIGAVVRMIYTTSTGGRINISGMIFDEKAVTSFIPELNCGLFVPLGAQDGNVNYTPKISYTLNKPLHELNCKDPAILRGVMSDYRDMAQLDKNILLKANPPIDTSTGALFIRKILGSTQVSPTQCAIQWLEELYDLKTNLPIPFRATGSSSNSYINNVCGFADTIRNGLISYKIDTENWYSPNLIFDSSGFKLYETSTIPACVFDSETYIKSVGNRLTSSTPAQVQTDFLTNTFKNGTGPVCPQTLPSYIFNSTDYIQANAGITAANAVSNYISSGFTKIVKNAFTIEKFPTPIVYTKPLPTNYNLDNASGLCPTTSCDDLDVLYKLVDQYNSNPSLPGTILRVKRVFTAGPNQCDIDADVNYDSMIQDIVGKLQIDPSTGAQTMKYSMVKKGTVTYTTGSRNNLISGSATLKLSGVQTTNMALYPVVDVESCSYTLATAGEANSGTSIQTNTPYLYKPLDYAEELLKRGATLSGSGIAQIQTDFATTGSTAKELLTKYRANTYSAIGKINTLTVCPNSPSCTSPNIQNQIIYYYQQTMGLSMTRILNIGSVDGKSCDVTFTNTGSTGGSGSGAQTIGMQFGMAASGTSCTPISWKYIEPTPNYEDTRNLAVPLSAANIVSGFKNYREEVNYMNPFTEVTTTEPKTDEAHPLKVRSFGLDRARNSTDSLKEVQFKIPLEQVIPIKQEGEAVDSYRFLRFVPLKTRDPDAQSVGVSKITFFYEGKPLALKGKVTNPMGTWEGELKDVMGPGFREGWSDAHKKPLVFAFKDPLLVDAYSFTTASTRPGNDPVAWKLEGSRNGSFWTLLDTQQRFPTPVERFHEILPQTLSP